MIKLQTSLVWPGCSQGKYIVKAKGCMLAALRWGTAAEPLPGWGPFAYVPVDPAGNGVFSFSGRRGLPREATHVWARCYAAGFASYEDVSAALPEGYTDTAAEQGEVHRFSILTDLHLASRPWKIRQALRSTESGTVFLLGDSTNDGLPEQFAAFTACIEETVPEKTIFPVTGNHDVLHASRTGCTDGCGNYADFQRRLLAKAEEAGHSVSYDPDGRAYAVRIGGLDIISLQCVTTGRKFLFPEGRQIDWLEERLASADAAWRIILCHAPLLAHNPNRNAGVPYLDKNRRLQEIVDRNGRIIFLSGHTHVSPNVLGGNGEYDAERQNIYLDCGSVVATDTSGEIGLMSPDWKDGCETELIISNDTVEISMSSIESGVRFPRGYYRFSAGTPAQAVPIQSIDVFVKQGVKQSIERTQNICGSPI